jgi:hypothetical protein
VAILIPHPPWRVAANTLRRYCASIAFAALLLGIAVDGGRPANAGASSEYEIKAAFLLKFGGFVDWPDAKFPEADTPFLIGLLGTDPFKQSLDDAVRDRKLGDRPIELRRASSSDFLTECHIVFIADSDEEKLPAILETLHKASVLSVGDSADFAEHGGIIYLKKEGDKIRFEINVGSARQAGLSLDSKLLNLARAIWGQEEKKADEAVG